MGIKNKIRSRVRGGGGEIAYVCPTPGSSG